MAYGTVNTDLISDSSGGKLAPISSVFRNRIINGAMVIDQRNAGASITVSSGSTSYPVDRMLCYVETSSSGTFTAQQSSSAPAGFKNSVLLTTATADSSITAAEGYSFQHRVEGYNIADLGWGTADAKTVTLSFWVKSSLTGTFAGSISNGAFNRAYVFNYTISSANTWEQKSVTIAGDTGGTWTSTNGTGLIVYLSVGAGSNYNQTANTWGSFGYSTSGAVNVIGTASANISFTGVQLEVGSSATGYEYRQYQQELALCQRYYAKSYAIATAPATAYTAGSSGVSLAVGSVAGMGTGFNLPVTLRTAPTLTVYDAAGTSARMTYYSGGWTNGGTILASYADTQQGFAQVNPTSTAISFQYTVSAEL